MTITLDSPFGPGILPSEWELSVWQKSTRDDPLVNINRDASLPSEAEIVIIGSGLSGAVTAYNLLKSANRPKSIVVLEAREACSGASGRNAGHCRPDAFRGYNAYSKTHGSEASKAILRSEAITLNKVAEFVETNKIDCELTLRPTLDLCMTDTFEDYINKAYADGKAAGVDVSEVKDYGKEETQNLSRAPNARKAFEWKAATINPAKLCYGAHHLNIAQGGYEIYTHCPVLSVTPGTTQPWSVNTTKGSIQATKVIYATNAYTKLVLPEMEGLITPWRAQAMKLTPPPVGLDTWPRVEQSMSLRYELHRFYSLATRPDNTVVLGCARNWPGMPEGLLSEIDNTMDDSKPDFPRSKDTMEQFVKIFPGGGYDASTMVDGEGGLEYAWAGIIGMTPDSVPFVGPLPDRPGQYIIAGFNGHGMARIFHCAPCLAGVVLGEEWDETVPEVFQITQERLDRLRKSRDVKKGLVGTEEATKLVS